MARQVLSYCGGQVRRLDPDRYLTALFIPRTSREHVFALYAFNSEIARAREVVSEPALAAIRLQWWRDAIARIYGSKKTSGQPIVEALGAAIRANSLSRSQFEQLIEARQADLDPKTPADMAQLEQYSERTAAPLLALVVEVLGAPAGPARQAAQGAVRAAGTAWALTGLLRAVPFHARAKLLYLPQDLLDRNQVNRRDLFELHPSAGLAATVQTVADRAREHLAASREHLSGVPRQVRPGLLTMTVAAAYLSALRRADYDVFAMPRALPSLALRLAWARIRGRY